MRPPAAIVPCHAHFRLRRSCLKTLRQLPLYDISAAYVTHRALRIVSYDLTK